MIREKIVAAEDVLDDVTLQYLSATCPQGKDLLITDTSYLLLFSNRLYCIQAQHESYYSRRYYRRGQRHKTCGENI